MATLSTSHSTHEAFGLRRRIIAIASVSAGALLYTMDANIANVALPTIAGELHLAPSASVWLVSVYNLILAMTLLPLAAVGDRIGLRQVYGCGLTVYLLGAIGCNLAQGFGGLLVTRAFQAVGTSAVLSVSLGLVRVIYPPHMLGRGMGVNTMFAAGGSALAPVLGGFLIAAWSWEWVFAAGAPLALTGLSLLVFLPDSERSSQPYDALGALLCALTFGSLIFGFQALGKGTSTLLAVAGVGLGLVVMMLFVRHERRVARPVLPVDLLAQPVLGLSVASALSTVLASTALLLFLPFRLTEAGYGAAAVGTMIAPYAFAVFVAAPTSGLLSDRFSPQILGILGNTLAVGATLTFAWLPEVPSFGDLAWRTVLCGTGFSTFLSSNGRLVIASAPPHRVAGASSLLSTTRMFGQALGSAIVGGLLALEWRGAPVWAATGLAALGLLLAVTRLVVANRERRER